MNILFVSTSASKGVLPVAQLKKFAKNFSTVLATLSKLKKDEREKALNAAHRQLGTSVRNWLRANTKIAGNPITADAVWRQVIDQALAAKLYDPADANAVDLYSLTTGKKYKPASDQALKAPALKAVSLELKTMMANTLGIPLKMVVTSGEEMQKKISELPVVANCIEFKSITGSPIKVGTKKCEYIDIFLTKTEIVIIGEYGDEESKTVVLSKKVPGGKSVEALGAAGIAKIVAGLMGVKIQKAAKNVKATATATSKHYKEFVDKFGTMFVKAGLNVAERTAKSERSSVKFLYVSTSDGLHGCFLYLPSVASRTERLVLKPNQICIGTASHVRYGYYTRQKLTVTDSNLAKLATRLAAGKYDS